MNLPVPVNIAVHVIFSSLDSRSGIGVRINIHLIIIRSFPIMEMDILLLVNLFMNHTLDFPSNTSSQLRFRDGVSGPGTRFFLSPFTFPTSPTAIHYGPILWFAIFKQGRWRVEILG